MRNLDLAWAAGFFDGEGTAYAKKNGKYRYLYLGLSQRDIRPMNRWVNIVQCGRVYQNCLALQVENLMIGCVGEKVWIYYLTSCGHIYLNLKKNKSVKLI
jgi:hypothetical protein